MANELLDHVAKQESSKLPKHCLLKARASRRLVSWGSLQMWARLLPLAAGCLNQQGVHYITGTVTTLSLEPGGNTVESYECCHLGCRTLVMNMVNH